MKKLFLLLIILSSAIATIAQSHDEQRIKDVLSRQSTAWNEGNIDGFMKGYWQNDSLMFIGKKGITYGWENTLNNYKKSYPDAVAMGKLQFDIIQVKKLSDEYGQVIGKWHLQRAGGDLEGYFTLLFRKIKGQWLIVADHTS